MRKDLAESLFAAFVFRVDPILARGAWENGTPLSDDDLAWIVALGHIMRMELFPAAPPAVFAAPAELAGEYGRLLAERDRLIAAGVDPAELELPVAPPSESELRAMHGDR